MEHHFNIEDAKKYGLAEATILYNLKFWVDKNKANNKHFYDGYYWTYNSVKAFETQFPYLTKDQIRRCLDKLENMGAIKSSNYNSTPYDKTKWYCVLSQIDLANLPNGDGENPKPIPYNKPNEKQDIKKDNIAETKVSAFSLHKHCVEYWCKVYKPGYIFNDGKDGKMIKKLYGNIKQSMVHKKGSDVSDEEVFESFKIFCSNIKNIDKFYHNMDIPSVCSHYNVIAEKIRDYVLSAKGKPKLTELKPIWEQELTEKDFQNPLDYENYLYLKKRYKNGTK